MRRLADVLLDRKVVSGRRARRLLYKAQRKELRRARIIAEKDRRNQQVWAAEMRKLYEQVAKVPGGRAGKRDVGAVWASRGRCGDGGWRL